MLPILLAFAAGVLLAHVVRLLIAHRAQDLDVRRWPPTPRTRDAWLRPGDEEVIRRSRDLARRLAAPDGARQRTRGELAPPAEPRTVRETASASPLRGFGVTFRVRH